MGPEKQVELFRVDQGRGGRCTFQLAESPSADISRVMRRCLTQDPVAFEPHVVRLMERIENRQPITLGDAAQLFKMKPLLVGLSAASERTFALLAPTVRDAQQNLILRSTYFRSSREDAA